MATNISLQLEKQLITQRIKTYYCYKECSLSILFLLKTQSNSPHLANFLHCLV